MKCATSDEMSVWSLKSFELKRHNYETAKERVNRKRKISVSGLLSLTMSPQFNSYDPPPCHSQASIYHLSFVPIFSALHRYYFRLGWLVLLGFRPPESLSIPDQNALLVGVLQMSQALWFGIAAWPRWIPRELESSGHLCKDFHRRRKLFTYA